ncbi:AAA family ATPase [Stutzerimonas nitrititolerans]|uniref:AAA family ATPase n=1 Tax=Stutzerimonas nitrititolerans TaxID=2482751 RepID=A0AA41WNU6_9GAMM|nr:AAA family ATPase [Stutzerimonas nitrititolerans]
MEREESPVLVEMQIPTQQEPIRLGVKAGRSIFILGRNGTGKSALVNNLAAQWTGKCVYMPGSRPSYFDHESLSMTPATRRDFVTNISYYDSPDSRWKSLAGTTRNEKAIHDLQAAETQYKLDAANQIKAEGSGSSAIARLQSDGSPLDIVNSVLSQANLSVQLEIAGGELRASQAGSLYSYARMSDGERSALIFSAEVVAAPSGTVFLIDEPELHLHPSIVIALIKALILTRPDCGFVVCTHELELPIAIQGGEIVLVRGSVWQGGNISSWDVDVIHDPEQIPEWLWVDVIGARRKILFIEGNDRTSLDQPLYSLLFPAVSVRPLESCKDVIRAVEGLRAVEGIHRTRAFGLIDHDGMSAEQMRKFEDGGIYPLPIFSVESLIYSSEAQSAVSLLQAETLGVTPQQLLDDANRGAIDSLKSAGKKEHLASRLAERHMRDRMLSMIPTRQQLIDYDADSIDVTFISPYPMELEHLTALIETKNLEAIVSRYPVRESGVLNGIAKGLRFNSRDDYERAVLRRIHTDSNLRNALKMKLSNLAAQLE